MKKILKYINFNVMVRFIGLILVVIFQSSISSAEVPGLINYQGRLTESEVPVTGSRSMTFRIYNVATDGTAQWTEVRDGSVHPRVSVTNGVFSIKLGEFTSIPSSVFSGPSTYLETQVGTVILGRERLVTVPYAYHSAVADSVSTTGSLIMTSPLTLQNTSLELRGAGNKWQQMLSTGDYLFIRYMENGSVVNNSIEIHRTGIQINGDTHANGKLITYSYGYFYKGTQFWESERFYGPAYFEGHAHFLAGKTGYVVDIFKNVSGNILHRGDLVKLSDKNTIEYYGKDNLIPISGIELSDTSEDTKVIGFISEKGRKIKEGEQPEETKEEDASIVQPEEYATVVTLGTFAICNVDATNGPIKIGDLLTSSSNPGYAMKAKEPKIGTIIGKALQNLDSGAGIIGVLVGAR